MNWKQVKAFPQMIKMISVFSVYANQINLNPSVWKLSSSLRNDMQ
jgi:hypothetical protein